MKERSKQPHPKAAGSDNRLRDGNSVVRRKHGDATIGTLRRMYGEDFASSYRSDAKLSTLLERTGAKSVDELINREIFSRTEAT
ncbi:MAG: hypothetical protein ACREES_01895, partial [Stellaceae bacterium]